MYIVYNLNEKMSFVIGIQLFQADIVGHKMQEK